MSMLIMLIDHTRSQLRLQIVSTLDLLKLVQSVFKQRLEEVEVIHTVETILEKELKSVMEDYCVIALVKL